MLKKIWNYIKKVGIMILGFFGIFLSKKNLENKDTEDEEGEDGEEKIIKRINISIENTSNIFSNPKTKIIKQPKIYEIDSLGMSIYKNDEFIIYKVYKRSKAESLGINENDVITKINSKQTKNMEIEDFLKEFEKENIEIKIKDKKQNIKLTPQSKEVQNPKPKQPKKIHQKQPSPINDIFVMQTSSKKTPSLPKQKLSSVNINVKNPIFNPEFKQTKYKRARNKVIIAQAIIPALIIESNRRHQRNKSNKESIEPSNINPIKKSSANHQQKKIQEIRPTIKQEIKQKEPKIEKEKPKEPKIEEVKTKEAPQKKQEENKNEKQLTPEEEAIIITDILEKDYEEKKQIAKLKEEKQAILELISTTTDYIKPYPLVLLGFSSIRNLFQLYKQNNSLIASRNILGKQIPYRKINYLVFLNKKMLINMTEDMTLKNIYQVESLKIDLIKKYGPLIKKDPYLINIINNLDITYNTLISRYDYLIKNKNNKIKKKTLFH